MSAVALVVLAACERRAPSEHRPRVFPDDGLPAGTSPPTAGTADSAPSIPEPFPFCVWTTDLESVQRFGPDGDALTAPGCGFRAIDPLGRLYVPGADIDVLDPASCQAVDSLALVGAQPFPGDDSGWVAPPPDLVDVAFGPRGDIYVLYSEESYYAAVDRYDGSGAFVSHVWRRIDDGVRRVLAASDGTVFVGAQLDLVRVDGTARHDYPTATALPFDLREARDFALGPDGRIYVTGEGGLYRFDRDGLGGLVRAPPTGSVYLKVLFLPDGRLLVWDSQGQRMEALDGDTLESLGTWTGDVPAVGWSRFAVGACP